MPPSGFNQNAINGLLLGVAESYVTASKKYDGLSETEKLAKACGDLENTVDSLATVLGISQEGARGYITFITENFRDLTKEIYAGKDKYDRSVIEGQAIQKELAQINLYLKEFKL